MRIVAVGGSKGGLGKSTSAVLLAAIAAREGRSVVLVDGDANGTSTDIADQVGDALPAEVLDGRDPDALRRLRGMQGYDLAVVDLPGTAQGALRAVLQGKDDQPAADLLVMPSAPERLELLPLLRVLRAEVQPLGLPHLIVFTRVRSASMARARAERDMLRAAGFTVAEAIVHNLTAFDEAIGRGLLVLDVPGAHAYARVAEADYRQLAAEVFTLAGLT